MARKIDPMDILTGVEPVVAVAEKPKEIKGKITVAKVPGGMEDVEITGKITVLEAFAKAGFSEDNIDGCELQVNGTKAKTTTKVEPGDNVLAVAKIRGNRG
jgi:hypothetical protein